MITFLETAPDIVGAHFSKEVAREDIARFVEKVEASLDANRHTHLFVELSGCDRIHWEAIPAFFERWAAMLKELKHFGRVALVSDERWMRWAATLESALLPHIRYETFTMDEREKALAWVNGERARPHAPAVKLIETSEPSVLGFELDGKLRSDDLHAIATHFNAKLQEGSERLRMFGRIKRIGGFDPAALLEREYFEMKRGMLDRLERYAVVGGPDWFAKLLRVLDPLFRVEIRHFEAGEEKLAWAWLGAEPLTERALVA